MVALALCHFMGDSLEVQAHQQLPNLPEVSVRDDFEGKTTLFHTMRGWLQSFLEKYNSPKMDRDLLSQKEILMKSIVSELNEEKKLQRIREYDQFLQHLDKRGLALSPSDSQDNLLYSLNEIYGQSPEPYHIRSIVDVEMHLLSHDKNISELLQISLVCDNLSIEVAHSCYRPVLLQVAANDQQSVKKALKILRDRWLMVRAWEHCHFLAHELGYALYSLYGLEGAQWGMDTYDECSYGLYHGLAQAFTLETYKENANSILESEEYKKLMKSELSFEIWSLHHGMGHALFEIHDDLEKSFEDCDAFGAGNPTRTKSCYYGTSHEFGGYAYFQNISLFEASKSCPQDTLKQRTCLYMLGHTFTDWQGYVKTAKDCSLVNESPCFIGLAAVMGVKINSLPKSERMCLTLFPKEMLSDCYQGLAISYLYYDNNLNGAFDACALANDPNCYNYLRRVYMDDLWFKGALCDNLDPSKHEACEKALGEVIR